MQEKDRHDHYAELAAKYLSQNASAAEVQELEAWVSARPENKGQFIDYKKIWLLTKIEENRTAIDVAKNWQQTEKQLFKEKKEAKVVPIKSQNKQFRWLNIAATIALVLVGSWVYFTYFQTNELYIVNTNNEPQTIDLADGSQVTLNQETSIRFTIDEKAKQRSVELIGDAFFEVARDENLPFVIQAADIEVEVLGTSFYVDARAQESTIQVIVESGKVAVQADLEEQILNPNEQAIYTKLTKILEKQNNEDSNFNFLKTGTLHFENTTLEEVVFALSRQYHANIRFGNEALKNCEIDATFKNRSLEAVLTILSSTFGIQATSNDDEIVITGGCETN